MTDSKDNQGGAHSYTDVVDRLRKVMRDRFYELPRVSQVCRDAADEIERLRAIAQSAPESVAWRWNDWQHCSAKYTPPRGSICEPLYGAPHASGYGAWQPIETAPKDKPLLGVWWSDITVGAQPVPHIGIYLWAGAWCPHDRKLTHWQPLPDTPVIPSTERTP